MTTSLRPRNEPVTYWLTVGDQVITNKFDKRIAEIRLGLTGQIPDGLLFRVSSIDNDSGARLRDAAEVRRRHDGRRAADTRRQLSGLTAAARPS